MAYSSHKSYRKYLRESLENEFLHTTLGNFTDSYPLSREKAFEGKNIESIVKDVVSVKENAVSRLKELFEKFREKAEAIGVTVYLAKNAMEANRIISGIARENSVRTIIKSKSMTSEEIYLNNYLEKNGFEVTETDLGEWIIQLRKEGPSHMVIPAVHLSKEQVSDLFSKVTGKTQPGVIKKLVKVARKELRWKFIEADMGISGANIAIAESGTMCLVTNEGNARLVTTLPKIQVSIVGIEKLVPNIEDALKILKVLPGNATGQTITSYVTWITGANTCGKDPKGNKKYHIVFLDNGRLEIASDPVFSEVLHCVRCGACANVCPVYGMVGGHKMGHTYIGPIGLILTYFYHGKENARYLVQNCINCQACQKVCASGIKLPELIKEVQNCVEEEDGKTGMTKFAGKLLKNRKLFHAFLHIVSYGQKPFTRGTAFQRHLPNILFFKDQGFRSLPAIAKKSLRGKWKTIKPTVLNPTYRVALFAGCLNDFVYPEQVEAALKIFTDHNVDVEFPVKQNCCGLPLMMLGDKKNTKELIKQNIAAFDLLIYDYIVTLCASCGSFLKESYPKFIKKDMNEEADRVLLFSGKIIDFSSLVMNVLQADKKKFKTSNRRVAYHSPCHLCRGLGVTEAPRKLLKISGLEYIPSKNEEVCCGLGGTYTIKFPEISSGLLEKKLDNVEATDAEILVTDCPGCIMQLRGGVDKRGNKIKVKHMAEILSEEFKKL